METTPCHWTTILFGAFDRHNLGDLLFPHIAARLLGQEKLLFAGLAERDLSGSGGYRTRAISQLTKELGTQPLNLVHVGGELLTCNAWQAAVMVQSPLQVQSLIRRLEGRGEEREQWIREVLGVSGQAPYTLPRELFAGITRLIYTGVGGVDLNVCNEAFRIEVITKLKEADYVSVRDQQTRTHLHEYGITTHLVPDPVVLVAELFGERIERHARSQSVAALHDAFPNGYLAVQFSADFGDDTTLGEIAAQLDQVAGATGMGVVLFRAGAAPWHDELSCYRRLAGLMHSTQVKIFTSLNIWDICALLACSHGYCGSSLHGRIVAMAFGLPRLNFSHPRKESRTGKQAAYSATWELPGVVATVDLSGITAGTLDALASEREELLNHAQALAAKFLEEFATIDTLLKDCSQDRG